MLVCTSTVLIRFCFSYFKLFVYFDVSKFTGSYNLTYTLLSYIFDLVALKCLFIICFIIKSINYILKRICDSKILKSNYSLT